jgi:hypothetical protein
VRTYGAVEDYEDHQLVVGLPHRDLVDNALKGLGIGFKEIDTSPPLGLALLTLDKGGLAQAAAPLRQDGALVARAEQAKWRGAQPSGAQLSDLDLLLSKLCGDFSSSYAGWIPDIGKNRLISPVRGLPYVDGCAVGHPEQLGLNDPVPGLTSGNGAGWSGPRPAEPGQGVRVGLLDTKLYPNAWLQGGYLAAGDDMVPDPPPGGEFKALEGHGAFVAGLILQQAPGAALVVRPVLTKQAVGKTWDVAKIMAEFAGTGVDILNLSFGCYTDDGQPPLVLAKAVSLLSPQILLVAAAGNHGNIQELWEAHSPLAAPWTVNLTDTTPVWPAAFAEVTAVGASDADGNPADFSPKAPWVDATAPGVGVESTYFKGTVRLSDPGATPQDQDFPGFAQWQGTSFAAATVSGAIAARIGPGCDAQHAREAVLDNPGSTGIQRFSLGPVTPVNPVTPVTTVSTGP